MNRFSITLALFFAMIGSLYAGQSEFGGIDGDRAEAAKGVDPTISVERMQSDSEKPERPVGERAPNDWVVTSEKKPIGDGVQSSRSPISVPEPTIGIISMIGVLGLLRRRRVA